MRHRLWAVLLVISAAVITACSISTAPEEEYVVVTPPPRPPGSLTVSPDPATISVGGTVLLVVHAVAPAPARDVTWSTSDARIATVDARTGVVTGVSVGIVTITATGGGYAGSGEVTVYEPATSGH